MPFNHCHKQRKQELSILGFCPASRICEATVHGGPRLRCGVVPTARWSHQEWCTRTTHLAAGANAPDNMVTTVRAEMASPAMMGSQHLDQPPPPPPPGAGGQGRTPPPTAPWALVVRPRQPQAVTLAVRRSAQYLHRDLPGRALACPALQHGNPATG